MNKSRVRSLKKQAMTYRENRNMKVKTLDKSFPRLLKAMIDIEGWYT
jgi:hypothetical protein